MNHAAESRSSSYGLSQPWMLAPQRGGAVPHEVLEA